MSANHKEQQVRTFPGATQSEDRPDFWGDSSEQNAFQDWISFKDFGIEVELFTAILSLCAPRQFIFFANYVISTKIEKLMNNNALKSNKK